MAYKIVDSDLLKAKHQEDFLFLLNEYAQDVMGGGKKLPADLPLIENLLKVDNKLILLAYDGDRPIGIANSFLGFSTFKAKPLINVHDIAVVPDYRGKGVAKLLLQRLEEEAAKRNCCKITLEVLEGNERAQNVYYAFGFRGYVLDPKMGQAIFLEKEV